MPVCNTNKIPDSVCRSGWRLRPPGRDRSRFGNSGSTSPHNSSDTVHGATAIGIPPSLTTDTDGFDVSGRVPARPPKPRPARHARLVVCRSNSVVGCEIRTLVRRWR